MILEHYTRRSGQSPVCTELVDDCLYKVPVTGVQVNVCTELHPADGGSVIPRLQGKLPNLLSGLVMKVHHHRLHPGVVCVPGVVNIPSVDLEKYD